MKKWKEIYLEHTRGRFSDYRITGSLISMCTKSPSLVHCKFHIDESEKDPISRHLNLLAYYGILHEQKVFKLERESFEQGKIEKVAENTIDNDPIGSFKTVLMRMEKGFKLLLNFNIVSVKDAYSTKPDMLERDDSASSIFGEYHYKVIEVKSTNQLKVKHYLQAAFYNYVIGKIQGYTPTEFIMIGRDKKRKIIEYKEYKSRLLEILKIIDDIYNENIAVDFIMSTEGMYPWIKYHEKMCLEREDISLLPKIGPTKRHDLIIGGFDNISKIANASLDDFKPVKGIGPAISQLIINRAKAFLNKSPIILNDEMLKLSRSNIKIYIDLETVKNSDLNQPDSSKISYLFGVRIEEGDKGENHSFWVDDIMSLEVRLNEYKKFVTLLTSFPDVPIFHWGFHEKTYINSEFKEFGLDKEHGTIITRLLNIEKVFTNSIALPIKSSSIKEVSKYFGFSWSITGFSGEDSIAHFIDYLKFGYPRLKEELIQYNIEDVEAMSYIIKKTSELYENQSK